MILVTTIDKLKGHYSFSMPVAGKKNKKGIDPGDTVKIPVIKGGKVTCTTTKNGKEFVVKVDY
ncbi:MAG: hypothetical protein GF307_00050 [candidate division Zixibacteria bacterium]|nr:hypothetical protein [candidate division Zixibacteria bacterium]